MADSDNVSSAVSNRRVNPRMREIFVLAYDIVEPFFAPENEWAGHGHEHLAYRALHERFPELSGEQVFVIVEAAKRVFGSGGHPAPP
ncbi:MAG: hypothetical protein EG825_07420 [Rhodocyclaceae bacterium]|nr:hypothetical protein [Rhodocyclaceae bacterium]